MNVSAVGTSPYVPVPAHAQKPSVTATTAAPAQPAGPVDADGDRDGDTAVGDRLDVRG